MWLNCKVIKKVATPLFLHQPPFSGLSPLSSKKFRTPPPKWLNFWKVLLPTTLNSWGGGGGGIQLCKHLRWSLFFKNLQAFFNVRLVSRKILQTYVLNEWSLTSCLLSACDISPSLVTLPSLISLLTPPTPFSVALFSLLSPSSWDCWVSSSLASTSPPSHF